ncbi:hypothetical protein CVT24_002571 [Panaeolus cyanescens]|uniref:CxC2-like cysteine cluster KDZ transposase-associated domain-containing protein n=1 Tax=Panaeolus cyanescens TaxID=181874 RepID=A0A409YTX6_9AGAR|nr:hypothetical protein CVT24_002571 [Panaeolus cyanescens]
MTKRSNSSKTQHPDTKRPRVDKKRPSFRAPSAPVTTPQPGSSSVNIAQHAKLAQDSRGRARKVGPQYQIQQPSAPKLEDNAPPSTPQVSDMQLESDSLKQPSATAPKRQRATNHMKLKEWLELRSALLDELHRHDSAYQTTPTCATCNKTDLPVYRCRDCSHGATLNCSGCIVSKHNGLPLHRIEKWNDKFFEKAELSALGLRVQLGHDGESCSHPEEGPDGFMVFDLSGVHYVNIDYCGCQLHQTEKWRQLIRNQWFPASIQRPHTVFTFECLDTFHKLTLQGKGNIYDFYHAILNKSDCANISDTVYRYQELQRAFRLWRNLTGLKRSGRALIMDGIRETPPGGTTVECGACPHPGRNLPEGWEKAGQLLFLYTLFIAVDANFKLKCKGRNIADIELLGNTGVYVDESSYQSHIEGYKEEPEVNTCESEHDAIVKASTKATPGYAISGKGLALCTRHLLVRKNGVGDLQKGERYCNMDFIILSALMGIALRRVIITYDIACQWSKNLDKRMKTFPEEMQVDTSTTKIDFAIPSWHINGHGQSCRENFNIGYLPGAGKTCGEEPEVNWSHVNPVAPSVREMAPPAHRETLNDHWNGWNFRRTVYFRNEFRRRFKEAAYMSKKQQEIYDQLTATFGAKCIKEWTNMVTEYEADRSKPNPYEEPQCGTSLLEVRLALAKEDAADAVKGKSSKSAKVTLSGFFTTAFEIEDRQYTLRHSEQPQKKKKITKEMIEKQDKSTALIRQINGWREAQATYTPYAATLIAANPLLNDPENPPDASQIPLYLPSSFPPDVRAELKAVCDTERRMREGQADDALTGIRRQLRVTQGLKDFKKANISGTGNRPNTRSAAIFKQVQEKQGLLVDRYRRARSALLVLDPDGKWAAKFRELKDEDLRGPAREVEKVTKGKPDPLNHSSSRYEPSWIWLVSGQKPLDGDDDRFHDSMRVEWVKARARLNRWNEEFLLVQEEMRRWLTWLEFRAKEWEGLIGQRTDVEASISRGLDAYAHKQAYICRQRAARCATYWLPELKKAGINPPWAMDYVANVTRRVERGINDSGEDLGEERVEWNGIVGEDEQEEEEAMSGDDEIIGSDNEEEDMDVDD